MSRAALFRYVFLAVVIVLFIGSLAGIWLTGPVVVRVPPLDLPVDPSPERLRATVEKLCGEFSPRDYRHPENLDRAADWIAEHFRESGLEVEIQEYALAEGVFSNVVARRPGADPRAGAIVIGAHYDAYLDTPGANDNASGVAVLLELARTLPEDRPRLNHLFVAFSTEEPPFFGTEQMGSDHYARKLLAEGVSVELMIALDLVGFYSDEPNSQHFPFSPLHLLYPDKGNFIAVVGDLHAGPWIRRVKRGMIATRALPVHSFRSSPGWTSVDYSDHRAFRRLGLPGVQVTDTAFMRYPHYHMPEDTPDKLDYERMSRLVLALHGVLWEGRDG